MEEWRPVPGYEGLYSVSSHGRVLDLKREQERSLVRHSQGYWQLRLTKDGVERHHLVHRLVCLAFHGEPAKGQQAAHLDGDRSNARADNLAWVSQKENEAHKIAHGTRRAGANHQSARLSGEQVAEIRRRVKAGEFQKRVRADFGISSGHISDIINGRRWADSETPKPPRGDQP